MKHAHDDITCYLKAVYIAILFLVVLSGTDSHSRNYPVPESNLTAAVHQTDFHAILAPQTTGVAIPLPIEKPERNQTVDEKNKIAFDSRLFVQRLKTIQKCSNVIIPFPQLHINFQLIPLKQDEPPSLS